MTTSSGKTRLGQIAIAALQRHEEEQKQRNADLPLSCADTTTAATDLDHAEPSNRLRWKDIPQPQTAYPHRRSRRSFWRSGASWRSMIARLMPSKYKPSMAGKRVLAAMDRVKQTHQSVQTNVGMTTQALSDRFSSIAKALADFHAQAVLFTAKRGHVIGQTVFALGMAAIIASTFSFAPQGTANTLPNNAHAVTSTTPMPLEPVVVTTGDMNDKSIPTLTTTSKKAVPTAAPIIKLKGTRKVPVASAATIKATKKKLTPQHIALSPSSTKRVVKSNPNQKSVETLQANAINMFLDARIMAGSLKCPENNIKARAMYLQASSAAQRVDFMKNKSTFMHNKTVQNAHAELALLYTGVPGVEKNLKLAANIMKVANPNSASGHKVMQRLQIENPLLYLELQKDLVKGAVDSASTLKRPGRVHVVLDPRTKNLDL